MSKISFDKKEESKLNEAQVEIRHLYETISLLRSQLENKQFEKDAAVQKVVQTSADEIKLLKDTATSLRDELESLRLYLIHI